LSPIDEDVNEEDDDIFETTHEQLEGFDMPEVKMSRRARKHLEIAAQAWTKNARKVKGHKVEGPLQAKQGKPSPKSTPATQSESPELGIKAKPIAPVEPLPWVNSRVHDSWKSMTWRQPPTQSTPTSTPTIQFNSPDTTTNSEPRADGSPKKWANSVLRRNVSEATTSRRSVEAPSLFSVPAAPLAKPKKPAGPIEVLSWWDEL
jgi:hypothetical protein